MTESPVTKTGLEKGLMAILDLIEDCLGRASEEGASESFILDLATIQQVAQELKQEFC